MTTTNRRITTAAEVAALASEPEGETVDYKGTAKPKEWWELAKDLAAFANHLGGVVVLGAFERADGLPELRGLAPEEVAELALAYEKAALHRCRPSPLVTCNRIAWTDGREILCVNVAATTSLVGAQFYKLRRDDKDPTGPLLGSDTNAWQFPIRVGKDNVPLPLEEAIMHMSTHTRRIAILLAGVSDSTKLRVQVGTKGDESLLQVSGEVALRSISIEENVAHVTLDGSFNEREQAIPLDDFETVWRDARGDWIARISGFFKNWQNNQGQYVTTYFSRPRRGT